MKGIATHADGDMFNLIVENRKLLLLEANDGSPHLLHGIYVVKPDSDYFDRDR